MPMIQSVPLSTRVSSLSGFSQHTLRAIIATFGASPETAVSTSSAAFDLSLFDPRRCCRQICGSFLVIRPVNLRAARISFTSTFGVARTTHDSTSVGPVVTSTSSLHYTTPSTFWILPSAHATLRRTASLLL
eukprot:1256313-Prymnesium_polylepis.2